MDTNLRGKTALVGGGSDGIGKAVAMELAMLGAQVVLLARTEAKLKAALAELPCLAGQQHGYIVVDFGNLDETSERVGQWLQKNEVHILVNNTGGPPGGAIVEARLEEFLSAYNNHLLCNQLLAQLCVPSMRTAGYGRIINIISTSVKQPLDGLGVSNTTRAAVANWAKTWANEVAKWGITVNNVLPGATLTQRLETIIRNTATKQQTTEVAVTERMQEEIPMRRFAKPSEVAAAVAFLASPAAAYITGINIPVDGGRTKSL
jgi:3-oxoacyl-[acyl-carrier protein] reductase